MFNGVETFKEKLRATLSEPNSSSEKYRKSTKSHSSGHDGALAKAKSAGSTSRANSSANSGSQRRARWLRDKIRFNHAAPPRIPGPVHERYDTEPLEIGVSDPCDKLFEVNEINSEVVQKTPNNNDTMNYRNKWKYRGKNVGHRRHTSSKLPVAPISETDENGTDDAEAGCRPFKSILVTPKHLTPNRRSRNSSPVPSQCSISSDSEGECDNSHNPSAMLSNSNENTSRRKQSLFFTSFGVWSQESVMGSFRELSPSITALLEAAWNGQVGLLQTLLSLDDNLKNINSRDTKGRTALHLAAASGHAGAVELLLQKGSEVDSCDTSGRATPLMCAAASGSLASVEILLEAGANVNAGFEVGKTPLHWAVQAGAYDCVKRLLEAGGKQNPPIIFSENPLHVAASTGDAACLKLLLDYGADVSLCKGTNRSSALHIAAEEGNPACIRILLKAGASCDVQDARGHTPLHVAASVDAEATSVLLEGGANPKQTDRDGRTPLHCAINRGSRAAECLRVLLETSAEINAQDHFGYTPLHLAAVNETSQCVSILLKYGADVTVKYVRTTNLKMIQSISFMLPNGRWPLANISDLIYRTKAGTTALTLLVRKIPDVMRFLVERLDAAVTIHDHEPGDPDCEIKLDFRAVVPNSERSFRGSGNSKLPERTYYQKPRKETDFLTCVLAAGNKKILSHPLSEAFLTLKWQRVRKFFWASLLFQIALVLLFTVYVVDVYLIKCPAKAIVVDDQNPMFNLRTTRAPRASSFKNLSITVPPDLFVRGSMTPVPSPLGPTSNPRSKRSTSHFSIFSFNPTTVPKSKRRGNSITDRLRGNSRPDVDFGTRLLSPRVSSGPASNFDSESNRGIDLESELTNDEESLQYRIECHSTESWLTVTWCLLLVFTASMAIKEIFQLLQAPISYVMSSENWGQWLLIASVLIAAWPQGWPYPDRQPWQYPAAALGIWIGWGLMLLQVGRFPALGLYVQMLGKVAQNFGLVILGYACLLIAFALAFCVIFPGEPAYYSVPLAILKVLTMMVGEVDYEELFYDPDDPLLYPITAHILHAAFVVIVTIVLMNLLVGLAVSDIQGLQKGAKLNRLSRQTALISRLESFIFSKKLQTILPTSIGLILQRSALLVPSSYSWSYYFRPNDPRDKRVSKELKLASLRVAAARHSSRHTVQKVHQNVAEPSTPKQQFPVVSNVSSDATLRRLEQRLDSLQHQMNQIMHSLTLHMEEIKESIQTKRQTNENTRSLSP